MRGLIFCLISAMLALALTANSSYAQTKLNKIRRRRAVRRHGQHHYLCHQRSEAL
jgi:hypothetical protein